MLEKAGGALAQGAPLRGTDPTQCLRTMRRVNGVKLHVVEAGPADGPLVILLHGFPDFWWGWRRQIAPLAAQGFHVIAPDQRGYNRSDKPPGIAAYHLDLLAADVVGLAATYNRSSFCLAGHDWGGLVAWWTAMRHPTRIHRLAILNAPHPEVWRYLTRRRLAQAMRSYYIAFFQLPWLPERLLRAGNFALLRRALCHSGRPGVFTHADIPRYVQAWTQSGALTAMLNYYRALRYKPRGVSAQVHSPTLVIWGTQDQFLETELARASLALCDQGQALFLDRATHWVQLEEVAVVNDALSRFFVTG
ncbi:MAG: alpha/beta hydrolase [Caldilineaceae bacterium]